MKIETTYTMVNPYGKNPVFHAYPNDAFKQPAYIFMNSRSKKLWADWAGDDLISPEQQTGVEARIDISPRLKAIELRKFFQKIRSLVQDFMDGDDTATGKIRELYQEEYGNNTEYPQRDYNPRF